MEYKVRTQSKVHKIKIDHKLKSNEVTSVDCNGVSYDIKLFAKNSSKEHTKDHTKDHIVCTVGHRLFSVRVNRRPDGFPYTVILNGLARRVEIEKVESTRYKPPVAPKKTDGRITAMLPGLIVAIEVKPGDKVKAGDNLITLEAMKMENAIVAPLDGTITSLAVSCGQVVMKGHQLLEITPDK